MWTRTRLTWLEILFSTLISGFSRSLERSTWLRIDLPWNWMRRETQAERWTLTSKSVIRQLIVRQTCSLISSDGWQQGDTYRLSQRYKCPFNWLDERDKTGGCLTVVLISIFHTARCASMLPSAVSSLVRRAWSRTNWTQSPARCSKSLIVDYVAEKDRETVSPRSRINLVRRRHEAISLLERRCYSNRQSAILLFEQNETPRFSSRVQLTFPSVEVISWCQREDPWREILI